MTELLHTVTTLLDLQYCSKLLLANELDAATKHLTELTASVDNARQHCLTRHSQKS